MKYAYIYFLTLATCLLPLKAIDRPNILFVFSDDHTWQTISAYGNPLSKVVPTPNIDRIGAEGIRFDKCYVTNSICAPSRAVFNRLIPFGEYDNSPTKSYMVEHRYEHGVAHMAELSFGKHPAGEFYVLKDDPNQMKNLAGNQKYLATQNSLRRQLFDYLEKTKDPRVVGGTVDWDYYPHYGNRANKNWKVD